MSRPPVPGPETLGQGDLLLERALSGLDHRLQERVEAWERALESEVTAPLRTCLEEITEAHTGLLEEAGLASAAVDAATAEPSGSTDEKGRDEEPDGEGTLEWTRLRAYRNAVAREVVAPLLRLLEEHRPGETLSATWQSFVLELREAASPLPTDVLRAEPEDLYQRSTGEGVFRRVRKALVRGGRTIGGLFGRGEARAQAIPLRALARRYLRGESLPGVVDLAEDLQRYHGRAVLEVEMALGRWIRAWFPVEDQRHDPWGHLSTESIQQLERIRALGAEPESEPEAEAESAEGGVASDEATSDAPADGGAWDAEGDPAPDSGGEESSDLEDVAPVGDTPDAGVEADDAETGEEEPREPDPASVAGDLQASLDRAVSQLTPPDELLGRVREGVARLRAQVDQELRLADTPFAGRHSEAEDRRQERLRSRLAQRATLWNGWYGTSRARVALTSELLDLRADMDEALDDLFLEALDASVVHLSRWLGEGRDGLLALRDEAAAPDSPLMATPDREAVARAAEDYLSGATEILDRTLQAPLEPAKVEAPLREVMDSVVDRLAARLRTLPESLEVRPVREPIPVPDPEQPTRTIPLGEAVRQALDALNLEALRTSVTPLTDYLGQARAECRQVHNVVAYNLGAARDELRGDPEAGGGQETPMDPEALLQDARSLTLQGLERTARALEKVLAGTFEPYRLFTQRAHGIIHRAMVQARERITLERAVQEQIRDVRSLVRGWIRQGRDRLASFWGDLRPRVERIGKKGYVQVQRLIRKGRSAVGAQPAAEGEAERAMEVLRSIPRLLEPLPLVYRRLFSFQPVSDPALLVGRDDEIAWVTHRWTGWKDGLHGPSLLTGAVTVGHTSFLNTLESTLFVDARVVRLNLAERYRSPEALATHLARVLQEAGVLETDEGTWTLDRLASRLLDHGGGASGPPLVLLVEHLAHLFLRKTGGSVTLERFLDFQARTAPAVFWLSTASDPFWKLFRKTEPRAAALVSVGEVAAMERSEMEELIMTRHQRSGVPLEFLAPSSPNPLLKRKLQRARSADDRQALLREEFFDRLYRASQGNIIMAILLWLKSSDFAGRQGWLRLRPPVPLRFQFLEELDLDADFALMALLEHSSLTIEEFCTVFRVEPDQAFQTLELLRGRMLLDRFVTTGGLPEPVQTVRDGVRYRVPPILSQVVTQYLRNHNILH